MLPPIPATSASANWRGHAKRSEANPAPRSKAGLAVRFKRLRFRQEADADLGRPNRDDA